MVTITPLPQVNQIITGVITVRGATVPVVDLRRVLGLAQVLRELHTPIVLVQVDGHVVGLVVDEVLDVRLVPAGQVVSPQSILPESLGGVPLVEGLIRDQAGTVLLLDLAQLLRPLPDGRLGHTRWPSGRCRTSNRRPNCSRRLSLDGRTARPLLACRRASTGGSPVTQHSKDAHTCLIPRLLTEGFWVFPQSSCCSCSRSSCS
jgi:purine-binding chemotaxis protein CheW